MFESTRAIYVGGQGERNYNDQLLFLVSLFPEMHNSIHVCCSAHKDHRCRCHRNTRFSIEMWKNEPFSPDEIQKAIRFDKIASIIALATGSTIAYDQVNTTFFRVVIEPHNTVRLSPDWLLHTKGSLTVFISACLIQRGTSNFHPM